MPSPLHTRESQWTLCCPHASFIVYWRCRNPLNDREGIMSTKLDMSHIQAVKAKYERRLLRKKNVVGVGIGLRQRAGSLTDEMVLTVMVREKQAHSTLRPRDLIPSELDGVPVDVQEVGTIKAQ